MPVFTFDPRIKPGPWNVQPGLVDPKWSWLWQAMGVADCSLVFPMWGGSQGAPRPLRPELVTGETVDNNPTLAWDAWGIGEEFNGTSDGYEVQFDHPATGTHYVIMFAVVRSLSASLTIYDNFISWEDQGGGSAGLIIGYGDTYNAASEEWAVWDSASTRIATVDCPWDTLGVPHAVIFVRRGGADGILHVRNMLTGEYAEDTSIGTAQTTVTPGFVRIGTYTFDERYEGRIGLAGVVSFDDGAPIDLIRELTDERAREWAADPFGFLRPSLPQFLEWTAPGIRTPASGGTTYERTFTGGLTSAGAIARQAQLTRAGALTSAGAVVRETQLTRSGALTHAGALGRETQKPMAGTLTSSGALTTIRTVLRTFTGALSFASGTLVRLVAKPLAGALTTSSTLVKQVDKLLAGTLTSSGAGTFLRTVLQNMAGALTFAAGTLVRQAQKPIAGTLTSNSTLVKQVNRTFTGALTSSGALTKVVSKLLVGALSYVGTLATVVVSGSQAVAEDDFTLTVQTTDAATLQAQTTDAMTLEVEDDDPFSLQAWEEN